MENLDFPRFSRRIRENSTLKGTRERSPSPISASKIDGFSVPEFSSPFLNRCKPRYLQVLNDRFGTALPAESAVMDSFDLGMDFHALG